MAAFSNRCPAWFITFVFNLMTVSVCFSSSQCVDGTYEHKGNITCCNCAAGQYLVKHCTKDPIDGKCEICEEGSYSSQPNSQMSCNPCTSCDHPNDNREKEEDCTPARDTKCKCMKDHYCASDEEICKLCQPCKTCDYGVKIPCQGHNDTVCKDEGNNEAMIAGIVVGLIVAAIGVFLYLYFWRKRRSQQMSLKTNGDAVTVEMEPLNVPKDVDLQPHLPDIADVIGWRVMKDIAIRSGVLHTTIDSAQQNNPNDAREQTLELLRNYVEFQGKEAAENLIRMLQRSKHKDMAEKVAGLLNASTK